MQRASIVGIRSEEVQKYPKWEGQWRPGNLVLVWDPKFFRKHFGQTKQ
jgi:hypothetical protein